MAMKAGAATIHHYGGRNGETPPNTPWGRAQTGYEYTPGVIEYTTPSHGGFRLTGEALERIPERFRTGWAGYGWFEEDCDWAIVAFYFPELFTPEEIADAHRALLHYKPEVLRDE